MRSSSLTIRLENLIFNHRPFLLILFLFITIILGYFAGRLHIDAGFKKLLPLNHPYMKNFSQFQKEFGGSNQILVALVAKEGDIFTPGFFSALKDATDDVFFIPGVDRSRVFSLWTPNVRYTEVVEDGISAGNIVPNGFEPTPEGLRKVRQNILKSEYMGRIVANDFSGAIIAAELQELNPTTGEKVDYVGVSNELERIREKYGSDEIHVHIIGFAKAIGDMVDGASKVVLFFGISFSLTFFIVYWYTLSFKRTLAVLASALTAVVWQIGLLSLLGLGIDPMGILVPFLVFAIAVSHGVQMARGNMAELLNGTPPLAATRKSFRTLALPSITALITDTIGFVTILLIDIRIIQEMAFTAGMGVAVIIITNLFFLPTLISYVGANDVYLEKLKVRAQRMAPLWRALSKLTERKYATVVICLCIVLLCFGFWKAPDIKIGDQFAGVPELRADSRYNRDTDVITGKFSIGVDVITIFAESDSQACIDYDAMSAIDKFGWHMARVEGVQSVVNLAEVTKLLNAGWNEGSLKWRVLSRNPQVMGQAVWYVPSSSGLMNKDCSVMPIYLFTDDHKAETITRIVEAAKSYIAATPNDTLLFKLAGGNVGVMAATNEEVVASQTPILLYVFSAVVITCLVSFRSLKAVICILLPLGLVSILGYALMALMKIGLKVNTLPIVALGVGVGVDYGIYIYNRLRYILAEGKPLREAYESTLDMTGNGVLLTGISLALGVATWIFSPLKFQADMGVLLTYMFLVNMLGAIFLLPALASWLYPARGAAKVST